MLQFSILWCIDDLARPPSDAFAEGKWNNADDSRYRTWLNIGTAVYSF